MSRVVSTSRLAPDWLDESEQSIRSLVSKLTQLLIRTESHKFPPQHVNVTDDVGSLENLVLLVNLHKTLSGRYLLHGVPS